MGQKYEASLAFLVENISSLLVLATITLFKSLQFNQARHNFNLPFKQFITQNDGNKTMHASMPKIVLFGKVVSNRL